MHLIHALVASACTLHASAFLLPLEVSNAAEQAKSELASFFTQSVTSLDLDCPGCPFFGGKDSTQALSYVENKIVSTCLETIHDTYADSSLLSILNSPSTSIKI